METNLSEGEIRAAVARALQSCPAASFDFILPVLFGGLYSASQVAYYGKKDDNRTTLFGLRVDGGYVGVVKQRPAQVTHKPPLPEKNRNGKGLLIVDDIIGSGDTLVEILKLYPEASVLAPTYWPNGRERLQYLLDQGRLFLGIEIPQGQYVNFPWESNHPGHQKFMADNIWFARKLWACGQGLRDQRESRLARM